MFADRPERPSFAEVVEVVVSCDPVDKDEKTMRFGRIFIIGLIAAGKVPEVRQPQHS